ncbi:MAG TPA: menaquinol-cytochrome C reductase [Bacillota bacterium]
MAQPAERMEAAQPKRPNPLDRVYTWPHFLIIEFIALMVFVTLLFLVSVIMKAPLLDLARPEYTPNPAKAPWYFLALQELLLHMHPSLAGVIVPGAVLTLIAAIPYLEKDERGTGIWFTTRMGVDIYRFAFKYTVLWVAGLILFDEFVGTKAVLRFLGLPPSAVEFLGNIVIPVIVMVGIYLLLVRLVKRRWPTADARHITIALFTVFVASFVVLTVVGNFFRGESMRLVWPWELRHPH